MLQVEFPYDVIIITDGKDWTQGSWYHTEVKRIREEIINYAKHMFPFFIDDTLTSVMDYFQYLPIYIQIREPISWPNFEKKGSIPCLP